MIKLEDIHAVLKEQKIPTETIGIIIKELNELEEEKRADKESTPKAKNQNVLVLFDPTDSLKGKQFTGAILQIEDGKEPSNAIERLKNSAADYNNTKKGRRAPASSLAAALSIPRKFTKIQNVHVKSKEPLEVVITDNKI